MTTNGQTITKRLILTDTKDSLYLKSSNKAFDRNGNYCFIINQNGKDYFYTGTDKIGGFSFIGSTYGNSGEINYTNSFSDPEDKPWYYRNAKGTKIYGTAIGKLECYTTSNTKENMAITTTFNDFVYYYINGKLVSKINIEKSDKFYISDGDWCAFSENGNVIYFLKHDSLYFLYVNGTKVDSSNSRYNQLAINDNGVYIFAIGKSPEEKIEKYDYMFYIHSMDTILGYVRTVWDFELKSNGAYYYSGDDSGPYYIAINDKLYKGIKPVSNITLIDKNSFLYSFKEQGESKLNVNGKIYTYDFDKIFYPTLDKEGNFAFLGLKDYYLYKFVNGKKEENQISKYSVRPTPLYISPKGESLHYFRTDDSIYLYRDDKLIFRPISKNANFQVIPYKEILPYTFVRGKSKNGNSLFYVEYDSSGYFVFNGVFSNPMIPVKESSSSETTVNGEIIAGEFGDKGFFSIQKISNSKYLINVNNKTYKEIDDIDLILSESFFFDDRELIFYGVKGLSFYQLRLTL